LRQKNQSGQTIIETIVSVFVLTLALVTGLGLAVYSSSNAIRSRDQIIATNLAREGLEVVRMLRDSNWLAAGNQPSVLDLNNACTFPTSNNGNGSTTKPCFPEGLTEPTNLKISAETTDYRILLDDNNNYSLASSNGIRDYLLCLQQDGFYKHTNPSSSVVCDDITVAKFARRITITAGNQSFPFTAERTNTPTATGNRAAAFGGHSPEKVIKSYVVWQGRGCTPFPIDVEIDPVAFAPSTKCKIILEERLSNWKDYK
jgi:type II secretory pathway pseudopilin PulG